MSIIYERSPKTITVDGMELPVSWNFRTMMQVESLLLNPDIEGKLKTYNALIWFYGEETTDSFILKTPTRLTEAVDGFLWFYRCGEDEKPARKSAGAHKRVYDFETDSQLIYAAFFTQYGIELDREDDMHWWKFRALFEGLKGTTFNEVMRCRAVKIDSKTPKEQKEYYQRMKELYPLPEAKTARRENDELVEALLKGDIESIEKAKKGAGNGQG